MYEPIKPYQTRLLRLHSGDHGDPLVCDLRTAHLLDTKFEGLALRSLLDNEDELVEYEALSYTWGGGGNTETIRCNGSDFSITKNLFEALQALRYSNQYRHLWVDAICINQNDHQEKGEQVWNMLLIYQKASTVNAWLGIAQEKIEKIFVLDSSSLISGSISPDQTLNIWEIAESLSDIYMRPWFGRIWVQQEIFAARKIRFQCGNLFFKPPTLLSTPKLLSDWDSSLRPKDPSRPGQYASSEDIMDIDIVPKLEELEQLHDKRLGCFERFSKSDSKPDIIEALLDTGMLKATDPRDHIYAVLGMTEFPSRIMSVEEWVTIRQREIFVPIDYSTNLISVFTTMTWALLMKGGIELLLKFKPSPTGATNNSVQLQSTGTLPSWVIDFRLAATLFARRSFFFAEKWNREWLLSNSVNDQRRVNPRHAEFIADNSGSITPFTKLLVRGNRLRDAYQLRDQSIWRYDQGQPGEKVCQLGTDVYATDLLVDVQNSLGTWLMIWLLRPAGNNEYKALWWSEYRDPWASMSGRTELYYHWEDNAIAKEQLSNSGIIKEQHYYHVARRRSEPGLIDPLKTETFLIV